MKQDCVCDERLKMFLYFEVKNKVNFLELLKRIIAILFRKFKLKGEIAENTFFYSICRQEHLDRFTNIFNTCLGEKSMCKLDRCFGINLKNLLILFANMSCLKNFSNFALFGEESPVVNRFLFKIIFYLRFVEYQSIANYYKTFDLDKMKYLTVYSDVKPAEHLFIKEANRHGIITVTCQHGMYPTNISINSVHVLNYWRSCSKYALVWGKETGKQFKKYSPGIRIFECGDMNLIAKKFDYKKNIIGIIMDIHENREYNQQMINVAERVAARNGMKIWIRVHPYDNSDNYSINSDISSFKKDNENAEFLIAHTSTMLFSCIAEGRRVLVYKSSFLSYDLDDKICFSDSYELEQCIKQLNYIDWKKIIEPFYCCTGDVAKQKYITFFSEHFK